MKNKKTPKPTAAQRAAFRRSTSYGVLFVRSKPITKAKGATGTTTARDPGEVVVESVRRFGSAKEATIHGKRFKRIEKHQSFFVTFTNQKPNAWVNYRTGKTNPLIGAKRTNRR